MICALAHPPAEIDVSLNTELIAYALTSRTKRVIGPAHSIAK